MSESRNEFMSEATNEVAGKDASQAANEPTSQAMSQYLVVYITAPPGNDARRLAGALVEERLAACVNRVPGVESTYTWEGRIERDAEDLLIVKTRADLLDRLKERVQALHGYDVPEIIAVPIVDGGEHYLAWMGSVLSRT